MGRRHGALADEEISDGGAKTARRVSMSGWPLAVKLKETAEYIKKYAKGFSVKYIEPPDVVLFTQDKGTHQADE